MGIMSASGLRGRGRRLRLRSQVTSGQIDEQDIQAHTEKGCMYCVTRGVCDSFIEFCNRMGIIKIEYKDTAFFDMKKRYKYGNSLK